VLWPFREKGRREAAVAVSLGRKITGRGPCVGQRGRLAAGAGRQAEAQRGIGEGVPKSRATRLKAGTEPTQEEKKSFLNFF
jgi:hypothetical protein